MQPTHQRFVTWLAGKPERERWYALQAVLQSEEERSPSVDRGLVRRALSAADGEGRLWTPFLDLLDGLGFLEEGDLRLPGEGVDGGTRTGQVGAWIAQRPLASAQRHVLAVLRRSDSERLRQDVVQALPRVTGTTLRHVLADWRLAQEMERRRPLHPWTEQTARASTCAFMTAVALLEHPGMTVPQEEVLVEALWAGRKVRSFPICSVAFELRPDGTQPMPVYRAFVKRRIPKLYRLLAESAAAAG